MRTAFFSAVFLVLAPLATAADWLTLPSTYSHDPTTGARVSLYAPIDAPTAPAVANFRTSGYTHTRSSLNFGPSLDNYHRVERWGDQVRPYGEWQRPFRPYSTPYPNWGAPYAGLNINARGGYGQQFGQGQGPGYGQGQGPGYGQGQGPGYGQGQGPGYGQGQGGNHRHQPQGPPAAP